MSLGDFANSIVTVKREVLLDAIKRNREKHSADFSEAMKGYREAVVVELQKKLDDAKEGKDVDHSLRILRPESHVDDYDNVISMLEMSVSVEIQITEHQFRQFVRDQWQWKKAFETVAMAYSKR